MSYPRQLYSINRLREEFGMSPNSQAIPYEWWTHHQSERRYPVYRLEDCELISDNSLSNCDTSLSRISRSTKNLFTNGFVILDTATTGLGDHDQLIELAIIDDIGTTLHDGRYRPTVDISSGAAYVHGITVEALKDKPTFDRDANRVKSILLDKTVVIFNADFDLKILRSTYRAFSLGTEFLDQLNIHCAMQTAASAYGSTNQYGSISLMHAFLAAGGDATKMKARSALGGCQAILHVMKQIAHI